MIKKLIKHGNSYALVIDRAILDLLKISPESDLEITTDGRTMTVAPVGVEYETRVREARKKVQTKYAKAFKKLAE